MKREDALAVAIGLASASGLGYAMAGLRSLSPDRGRTRISAQHPDDAARQVAAAQAKRERKAAQRLKATGQG